MKRDLKKNKKKLEAEIEKTLSKLESLDPVDDNEAYLQNMEVLSKLYDLKEKKNKVKVKPDTLVAAGTNIFGILLVTWFEKANVITSKAFNHIPKV